MAQRKSLVPIQREIREQTVAAFWRGDAKATHAAMTAEGYNVSLRQIQKVSRYVRFPELVRAALAKTTGVMSRQELQEFWSMVVRGEVSDGVEYVRVQEQIDPVEDDYDPKLGGDQWRWTTKPFPRDAELKERLKASEILGRSLCMFVEQVHVEGNVEFSITSLLSPNIRKMLPTSVIDIKPVDGRSEAPGAALPPITECLEDFL